MTLFFFSILILSVCSERQDVDTSQEQETMKMFRRQVRSINVSTIGSFLLSSNQYFDTLIHNNQIVGLGESTHGTHESSVINCTIIKYLIKYKNCKTLCIEGDYSSGQALNQYVLGETEKSQQLLSSFARTQPDEPFRQVIEWIKEYNTQCRPQERVQVFGLGFYGHNIAATHVFEFLKHYDSLYYTSISSKYHVFTQQWDFNFNSTSSDSLKNWTQIAKEIQHHLQAQKNNYSRVVSLDTVEKIIHYSDIVVQNIARPLEKSFSDNITFRFFDKYRDSCLNVNAQWVIDNYSSQKCAAIWAHNGHIAKRVEGSDTKSSVSYSRLGKYLEEKYSDRYFAIGQTFFEGKIRVMNDQGKDVIDSERPPEQSIEFMLEKIQIPSFVIDIRKNKKDLQFFNQYLPMRMVGIKKTVNHREFSMTNIVQEFDALIFLNKTTAQKPIQINLVR